MTVLDPDVEAALAAAEAGIAVLRGADFSLLGNLDRLAVLERLERVARSVPGIGHELVAQLEAQNAVAEAPYGGMVPLLAQTLRIRPGTASTMIARARTLGPRVGVSGAVLDPVLPLVAPAQRGGLINADHVRVIVRFFQDVPSRVSVEDRRSAEEQLVEFAKTLRPDELEAVAARIMAHLNPDGSLGDERERRKEVGFWMGRQDADGLTRGTFCIGARLRMFLEVVFAKFAKPGMCNPEEADPVVVPAPSALPGPPELPTESPADTLLDSDPPASDPPVPDVPARRKRRRRRCPTCGGEVGEDGRSTAPADEDGAADPADPGGGGGGDADGGAVAVRPVDRPCSGHGHSGHGYSGCRGHGQGQGRMPPEPDPDPPDPDPPGPEPRPEPRSGCEMGPVASSVFEPAVQSRRERALGPESVSGPGSVSEPKREPGPELDLGLPPSAGASGGPGAAGVGEFDPEALAVAARLDQRPWWLRNADALEHVLTCALPDPRLGRHRGLPLTAVVTMTLQDLEAATGKALSGGGSIVPIREAIRMAAGAHPYLLIFDDDGRPLYLGRGKRLATADQRLVLYAGDRGCTFPGCPRPGYYCQSHHTDEWAADHGASDVDALTFACEQHHPLVGRGPLDWATTVAPAGGPFGLRTLWHPPAFMDPLRRGRVNHFHHPGEYSRPVPVFPGPDGEPPPQRE